MDWLTFISKLIGDLAWPAVVVCLLLLLRPYLGGLAQRLEELTLPGGARAKFRDDLEAAREQAIPVLTYSIVADSRTSWHGGGDRRREPVSPSCCTIS